MGNSANREEESGDGNSNPVPVAMKAPSEGEEQNTNDPSEETAEDDEKPEEPVGTTSTSSSEEDEPLPSRTLRKRKTRSEDSAGGEKKDAKSAKTEDGTTFRRSLRPRPPPEPTVKPQVVTSSSQSAKKPPPSRNQKSTANNRPSRASSGGEPTPKFKGIPIRPFDLVFGRGDFVANRPKMVEFRDYCFDKLADFVKSEGDQDERDALVQKIFDMIQNHRPKGRFLVLRDNRVDSLSDGEAMSRIRQMFFNLLRTHTPQISSGGAKKKAKPTPPTATTTSRAPATARTTRQDPPTTSTRYGRQVRPVQDQPLEMTLARDDRDSLTSSGRPVRKAQPAPSPPSAKKSKKPSKPAPKLPPGHILEKAVRDNDVLLGIGPPASARVGNSKFREFSESYQKDFEKLFRNNEMDKIDALTRKICGMIRALKPSGRFLDWKGTYFIEVDEKEAMARARKMFMNRKTKARQRSSSAPPAKPKPRPRPSTSASKEQATSASKKEQASSASKEQAAKKPRVENKPDPPPKSGASSASSRKSGRARVPTNRSADYEYGDAQAAAANASTKRGASDSAAPPRKASSAPTKRGASSSADPQKASSASTKRSASASASASGSAAAPQKASSTTVKRGASSAPPRKPPRVRKRRASLAVSPTATPVTVRHSDVILGRGSGISQRPGNLKFHDFCSQMRGAYIASSRNEKRDIAFLVVQMVKAQNPPGRFLIQQGRGHVQVSEERAIEKAAQALREKCFRDREELEKAGGLLANSKGLLAAFSDEDYDIELPEPHPPRGSEEMTEDMGAAEAPGGSAAPAGATRRPPEPCHNLMVPQAELTGPSPLEERREKTPRIPVHLHPNDVILDSFSSGHPGNENFEDVCRSVSGAFSGEAGRPIAQLEIAQEVLFTVQAQEPPGRFVEKVGDQYFEVDESVAVDKVRQAIHDCSAGTAETSYVTSPSSALTISKDPQVRLRTKRGRLPHANNASLVAGQRIAVYWENDDSYYEATILEQDANLHHIEYIDDGVKEWVDLSLQTIRVVSKDHDVEMGETK